MIDTVETVHEVCDSKPTDSFLVALTTVDITAGTPTTGTPTADTAPDLQTNQPNLS